MFTDEAMQEMSDEMELAQAELLSGDYDRERFVSEFDMELSDCVHENGKWSDHFPMLAGKFTPYSTFNCSDCGVEIEVKP